MEVVRVKIQTLTSVFRMTQVHNNSERKAGPESEVKRLLRIFLLVSDP